MPNRSQLVVLGSLLLVITLAAAGCGKHEDPLGAAQIDVKHKRYGEAIERLDAAPPEVRNTYEAQILLGRAYFGKQEWENSLKAYEKAADRDPNKTEPLLGMARVEEQRAKDRARKDTERARSRVLAREQCRRALAIDDKSPKAAEAYALIARIRVDSEEYELAREAYQSAIDRDPGTPQHKLDLASLLLRYMGKDQEALQLLDAALKHDPNLAAARILKASIVAQANPEEAKKQLRQVLRSKMTVKQKNQARWMLARLCLRTGELEEAKRLAQELQKAKARSAGDAALITGLITLHEARTKEDYEKAYNALKPLERSNDLRVLWGLANAEERLGKENQAIGHYQKIVKLDPKHVGAHLHLASLMRRQRDPDEAMKHCQEALKERPGNRDALRIKALIHRDRSSRHFNLEMAQVCYQRLLRQDPKSADVRLELAQLLLEMNRPWLAMAHAQMAGVEQDSARYRLVLGRIYLYLHRARIPPPSGSKKSNLEMAVEHLQQAKAKAPSDAQVVFALASAHMAQKKPQAAIATLKPFLSRQPEMGLAYIWLANVHESEKQPREAIKVLERAANVPRVRPYRRVMSALGRAYFLAGDLKRAIQTWQDLALKDRRIGADVKIGLAVALALDGQHQKALTRVDAVVFESGEKLRGPLLAACVAVQAGKYEKARAFVAAPKYPSTRQKRAYLDFPEHCRAAARGKEAAALISEGILHVQFRRTETAVERLQKATQLLPKSIIPYYELAHALRQDNRLTDMISVYRQMFEKFPRQGYPRYELAVLTRRFPRMGVNERQQIELALDLDPELAGAHIRLAHILLNRARQAPGISLLESALEHASQAMELDGGTKQSMSAVAQAYTDIAGYHLGELLKAREDPSVEKAKKDLADRSKKKAEEMLTKLRDKFPAAIEVALISLQFHLTQKDYETAASLADRFLRKWPEDQRLKLRATEAFAARGQYELATKYLTELIRVNPASVTTYRQLARVYVRMGQLDGAIAALKRAWGIDRSNWRVAFELADSLLRYGAPDDAKAVCESVLKTIPADSTNPRVKAIRAVTVLRVAQALVKIPAEGVERTNNLNEAANLLKNLAEPPDGAPPNIGALLLLGRIREQEKRDIKALELYEKCLKLAPKYRPAYSAKILLRYRRGQYGEAIKVLQDKVLSTWPYDTAARAKLALLYLARGDGRAAAGESERAMKLVERRANSMLAQSEAGEALYRMVRIITLIGAQKYSDARAEVKSIRGTESTMLRSYDALIQECSRDPKQTQNLARHHGTALFYQINGQVEDAIDALEKAAEAFPHSLFLLDQLATMYARKNDRKSLENLAETREKMLNVAGPLRGAIPLGYHQKLYVGLADIYLRRLVPRDRSFLDKALSVCKRGVKNWPNHLELLKRLADAHLAKEQKNEAIQVLGRITGACAAGTKPWVAAKKQLGLTYYTLGKIQRAADLYWEINEYIQDDADALNNSAWFHLAAPKPNITRAIQQAEKAKQLKPDSPNIRDTLGWAYYCRRWYSMAEREFDYAAKTWPGNAGFAYHLGASQVKNNKLEQGLKNLERALGLQRRGAKLQDVKACKSLIAETKKMLENAG